MHAKHVRNAPSAKRIRLNGITTWNANSYRKRSKKIKEAMKYNYQITRLNKAGSKQ